jgi:hypothetical protein
MSFLYWVYDDTCVSEVEHGYVGVSEQPSTRLYCLRRESTVPKDAQQRILFEGTREECLNREREPRPRPNMGWNPGAGGVAPLPIKHGFAPFRDDRDKRIRNIWGK